MDEPLRQVDERLRRGDPTGALDMIRAARDVGGAGPWLDLLEARAQLAIGGAREALRLVSRVGVAVDPALKARAALWWGRILAAEGDAAAARARVVEALDVPGGLTGTERVAAHADLAELDAREGAPDGEQRLLDAARALDGGGDPVGAAQVLLRLADRCLARGGVVDAERMLTAAEERVAPTEEPGLLVPVWERGAEVAIGLREPARALLLARRAIARSPPDDAARARLWGLVGRAHHANGDLEGARMAHRRSAELAERHGLAAAAARLDETAVLLALGRRAEARAVLAGTAATGPADPLDAVHAALSLVAAAGVLPSSEFAERVRRIGRWLAEPAGRSLRLLDAIDRAAEVCTDVVRAGQGGGRALARAVRMRAIAQRLALGLDQTTEAVRQGRLLHDLGSLGAPVPAGPFDLVRRVGLGSVGDVWRGRHHDRGVPVAIKALARRHESPRTGQLFLAEVRAMAVLDHPNIVRVLGTGTLGPEAEAASHGELRGGNPWFAMELAEGGTLDGVRGRLPWSGVRALVTSLLDALAHAHARGVIHLDLKCSNALLRRDEGRTVVMLSDFGLAKLAHEDPARGGVIGTPTTMAPEQFRGEARDFGPWTDLYALGAVTVELLTGRPVFDAGASFEAQREAHLRTRWPGLPAGTRAPPGLDAWLAMLLAKAPAERFQRAADAAHALARLPDVPDGLRLDVLPERFSPRSFTLTQHTLDDALEPETEDTLGPVGTERPYAPHRPAIPPDWRPLADHAPSRDFVDVAPTLFGLARVPLVGREAERDALWSALLEVAGGGGPQVIALTGAAGTGRTALARWLCERAHEVGAASVFDATEGPDGLSGLRAVVERHLRLQGLGDDAAIRRVEGALPGLPSAAVAALAALARGHAPPGPDPVAAVAAMVALQAAGRTVILRTERGALADPEDTELLRLLVDAGAPVLWVVACPAAREGERALPLGPLPEDAAGALLDALLPLAPPVRRAVQRAAGGHPGLMVTVVGDLLARDALLRGAQSWELRPGEAVRLPEPVLAAWSPRVNDNLLAASPPARTALGALALLGDRLDAPRLRAVAEVVGVPVRSLSEAFPELLPEDLERTPAFRHPAVRVLVHDLFVDLMAAEVAVAAVELHPEGCEVLRAQLLVRAGRMFEAPPALLDAAGRLLEEGDPEQALDLLDRRAEILHGLGRDPSGAEQVPDALLRARIAHEQGRSDAGTLLAIASALAERHEAWVALGESKLWRAEAFQAAGDPGRARVELRGATEAYARAGDVVGTARALHGAATLAMRMGEPDAARALLDRALDRLGVSTGPARAGVNASLAALLRQSDDLPGAERALADAHGELAEAPASVHAAVAGVAADLARDLGDAVESERCLRHALSRVPWHDVTRVRELQTRRAMAAIAAGRLGQARRVLDGLPPSPLGRLCQLVLAARADDGTWDAAWTGVADAPSASDRDVAWLLDVAGRRADADGRRDRALRAYTAALAVYRRRGLSRLARAVEERLAALTAAG